MSVKISIIGAAGTLGSCAAFALATNGLADEFVLYDPNVNLLKAHLLDLETAVSGRHNVRLTTGAEGDLVGSDLVIIAAGVPHRYITDRMQLFSDNLPIIKDIAADIREYCPQAVVITATNPVDRLNYAMHRITGLDRRQFLGYSLNDSYRFRQLAARFLSVDSNRVDGVTVGEHGPHQVMLFSTLRVHGFAKQLPEADQQRIRETVPLAFQEFEKLGTGRTTGWTSAVGLTEMAEAIINDTRKVLPASVVLNGEYGCRGVSVSLPVVLGRRGLEEIVNIDMTASEREEFAAAVSILEESARRVDSLLDGQGR